MKREFIKGLLGEQATKEIIDSILDENGKDVEIEKNKLTALQTEINSLKATITERDNQLEQLKNSPDNLENLKKQIETLQTENQTAKETYEKEVISLKKQSIQERELLAHKAKNNKAVLALIEDEEGEFDEEKYAKSFSDKLKELVKTDAYLFDTSVPQVNLKGTEPANSNPNPNPNGNKKDSEKTYEDFLAELN